MSNFDDLVRAYGAARARASVARSAERRLLHEAIEEAHRQGVSLRAAASLLRAPVSTVAGHWSEGHECHELLPVWGDAKEYAAAQEAIWAHSPSKASYSVPYQWHDEDDGSRSVTRIRCHRET